MTQWGLDTLFNPAKQHMDEEKRRLQATREEIGDSSGGKRIDLESGRVTIRRGTKPATESDDEASAAELPADAVPADEAAVAPADAGPEETVPDKTVPDKTVPDKTVPDKTVGDEAV